MSRKRRSEKSRRQSASGGARIPIDPRIIITLVAGLAVIGITLAIATTQPLGSSSQACTPTDKQYPAEPTMRIDTSKQYAATVKMLKGGEFTIQLFPDKAPRTVNSFVFLARDRFFDCVTFHLVLEGFMAQSGDPTGTGAGGPGYNFANEISDLEFDEDGVVAMTHSSEPDSNGSQFFITFGPREQLNFQYTIFGQVNSGMDVVRGLTRRDPTTKPAFQGDVIETITITEQ